MQNILKHAGKDIPAAIVVFLVAVPLCLGIAVASGLPPFTGIIAGIVGGIVVGLVSKSNLSVSGPAAGLTAIVAAAIIKLPVVEAFFLAVVLAGIFQVIMGVCKMGVIGDYIPNSVIKGMLAAIGIILILKQLPYLVGFKSSYEGDDAFIEASGRNTFSSVAEALNHFTPVAVFIGVAGLAILLLFETKFMKRRKIFNIISGPLVVVIAGILINTLTSGVEHKLTREEVQLVNIPVAETAAGFISFFKLPDWTFITNAEVWITAITLALVATLETLLGIEAVDKLDKLKRVTPPNRELIAQGAGNIVSGLIGGLPVTSVIVRSSANESAGAQTKISTILHGLFILLFVSFMPGLLNEIPLAALAAILVFVGYKLTRVTLFKEYFSRGWNQFVPFIVTILAIVFTDLLKGVLIGLGVGIFYILRSNFRTAILSMKDEGNYLIRLRKDVSFFSKGQLKQRLEDVPRDSKLLIDLSKAEFIDPDILDTIEEFKAHAGEKNIMVSLQQSTYNKSYLLRHERLPVYDDQAH